MKYVSGEGGSDFQVIGDAATGYLIYSHGGGDISVSPAAGKYALRTVGIKDGEVKTVKKSERIDGAYTISGNGKDTVYWLERL